MNIRNSAKAIIMSDNKVLLTKNVDDDGYFYLFPGGGQEHGETLHETVTRECMEEIGEQVDVGDLVHIREYIGKNHEYASFDSDFHQVEFYFVCTIKQDGCTLPSNPDSHQVGIEWVAVNDLQNYRIYPKELTRYMLNLLINKKSPIYLGDIN